MGTSSLPESIRLTADMEVWQPLRDELAEHRRTIEQLAREVAANTLAAYKVIVLSRLIHDRRVSYDIACSDSVIEYAHHLDPVLFQQAYRDISLFVANVSANQERASVPVLDRLFGSLIRRFSAA